MTSVHSSSAQHDYTEHTSEGRRILALGTVISLSATPKCYSFKMSVQNICALKALWDEMKWGTVNRKTLNE